MSHQNKINVLRTVLDGINKRIVEYKWDEPFSCNCGLVAQVVCGMSQGDIENNLLDITKARDGDCSPSGSSSSRQWSTIMKRHCPLTGLSNNFIIRKLQEAGFSALDISQLEFLSNEKILLNSGIRFTEKSFFKEKSNLVLYIESWIKLLEKDQQDTLSLIACADQIEAMCSDLIDMNVESEFYKAMPTMIGSS